MDKETLFDESGHSLFELSLSLPIMLMLTLTLGGLFLWSMKLFVYEMADWTLQNELCTVMERVVGDARAADSVLIQHEMYSQTPFSYSRLILLKPRCYPDTEKNSSVYFAHQPQKPVASPWKIYHTTDYEPITGDSMFCSTMILKFHCELIPPARLRIELKGKTPVTKHTLELKTEIFLPELMKNASTAPVSSSF